MREKETIYAYLIGDDLVSSESLHEVLGERSDVLIGRDLLQLV